MNKKYLISATIIALIGFILSVILGNVGINLLSNPSYVSFCNINETFNCDAVALSKYASHFGIPNFIYGMGYYLLIFAVAIFSLFSVRLRLKNFFVYLFWLSLISVLVSFYLFLIAHFVIKSLCILCMMIYVVNVLLLLVAFMAEKFSIKSLSKKLLEDIRLYFSSFKRTLLFIVMAFIGLSVLLYFNSNPLLSNPLESENQGKIDLEYAKTSPNRLVTGPAGLPEITILMFTDYECQFCSKAGFEIKKLLKKNPDIRLIFKDYPLDQSCNQRMPRPFHEKSCMASFHARCAAEQGKFWEYHDLVFQNQESFNEESLKQFAESLKLDMNQFNSCVSSKKYMDSIITDIDEAASLNVSGTPTLYFDGKRVEGFRTYEEYQKIVDDIRAEKKKAAEEYEKEKAEYMKQMKEEEAKTKDGEAKPEKEKN